MKKLSVILLCCVFLAACGAQNIAEEKTVMQSNTAEETVSAVEDTIPEATEEPAPEVEKENKKVIKEENVNSTDKNETAKQNTSQVSDQNAAQTPATQETAAKTVTVNIIGLNEISFEKSIDFTEGMTVLDATLLATDGTEYTVDYSGGKSGAYIKGIGGLYEKEHGAMSGWCYCVNKERANKGCGRYILKADDVIKWEYCTDFRE